MSKSDAHTRSELIDQQLARELLTLKGGLG